MTYVDKTEEFSTLCSLEDIQAFFGVGMGGLHLHGIGPVVGTSEIIEGEAYELIGTPIGVKLLKQVQKKTNAKGVTIIEKVEWDMEQPEEDTEVIPSKYASNVNVSKRIGGKIPGKRLSSVKPAAQVDLSVPLEPKPINWIIVMICCVLILVFLLLFVGYLQSYDPHLQLVLREEADQMTIASLSIVIISLLFGVLAFFH